MVKAEASKVTVAVATVVIFGTIAIFLYPAMYPLLAHWFSPETYGIYIGSTMHEVAQVVAAGHAVSPDAENAAVIAKMLRVMMLAPFLIILAARVKQLSPATGAEKKQNYHSVVCYFLHRSGDLQLFPPAAESRGGYAGDAGHCTAGDGNGGAGFDHSR